MKHTYLRAGILASAFLSAATAQAQNVGIGTTTPKSKLSVNGSTASGGIAVGDASYTSTLGTVAPLNGAIIQGDVGIGGTVPLAKLHVRSDTLPQFFVGPEEGTTDSIVRHYGMIARADTGGAFFGYIGAGTNPTASSNTGAAIIAGSGKDISFFTGASISTGYPGDPSDPANVSRMTIRASSGYVGIGTVAPQSQVDIRGTTRVLANPGTQAGSITSGTSNVSGFEVGTDAVSGDVYASIQRAGFFPPLHLSKPAGTVDGDRYLNFNLNGAVRGSVSVAGSGVAYNTTSDERLKENIRPSAKGLADVMKIQVSDYNYKTNPDRAESGFIAQQLQTIFPNAVTVGGENPTENPWTVDYGRVTPVLAKAIQELKQEKDAEIAELKGRLAKLEGLVAENAQLKKANAELAAVASDVAALKKAVSTMQAKDDGNAVRTVSLTK
jgi:hypothetical protein